LAQAAVAKLVGHVQQESKCAFGSSFGHRAEHGAATRLERGTALSTCTL